MDNVMYSDTVDYMEMKLGRSEAREASEYGDEFMDEYGYGDRPKKDCKDDDKPKDDCKDDDKPKDDCKDDDKPKDDCKHGDKPKDDCKDDDKPKDDCKHDDRPKDDCKDDDKPKDDCKDDDKPKDDCKHDDKSKKDCKHDNEKGDEWEDMYRPGDDKPKEACRTMFYQKEKVSVPVKITPHATPGEAKVTCCGKPVVMNGNHCKGDQSYCSFTVTQALCIEIPIAFGAMVETGLAVVECGMAGTDKCDCR